MSKRTTSPPAKRGDGSTGGAVTGTGTRRVSRWVRVVIDTTLFIGLVALLAPGITGLPIHEWGSLLIIVPLLIHVVVDWKWIVRTTRRFFERQPGENRFSYVLDWLLFVVMVVAIFSGVVISVLALPALGLLIAPQDGFWFTLHDISANLLMPLIGVHLAMNWRWIAAQFRRALPSSARAADSD